MGREDDIRFMRLAYEIAQHESHNPKTQTGAVIAYDNSFVSKGANSFVPNMPYDKTKINPPEVYDYLPHAEIHALSMANNTGFNWVLKDSSLYSPWEPCSVCAGSIALYMLKEVVMHKEINDFNSKIANRSDWNQEASLEIFKKAGVKFRYLEGKLFSPEENFSIMFRGRKFYP